MSLGLDPFALFVAVIALIYAVRESRRNNSIVLRLLSSSFSSGRRMTPSGLRKRRLYTFSIKNLGGVLHSVVEVALRFTMKDGHTQITVPLRRRGLSADPNAEFAKGMIGDFCFDLENLDSEARFFLKLLENRERTAFNNPKSFLRAILLRNTVFSQSYFVKEYAVGGFLDQGCKENWNGAGPLINTYCRFFRGSRLGSRFLTSYVVEGGLMLPSLAFHLMCCVNELEQ